MRICWKIIQEKSTFPPDGIMQTNNIFAHTVPGSTSTDDLSTTLGEVLIAVIYERLTNTFISWCCSSPTACYIGRTFDYWLQCRLARRAFDSVLYINQASITLWWNAPSNNNKTTVVHYHAACWFHVGYSYVASFPLRVLCKAAFNFF